MDYIEPMTLGSPVSSPAHPSPVVHQSSHGNQFLPGYLMGDTSAINSPSSGSSRPFGGKVQFSTPLTGMLSKSPPAKSTPQTPKPYLNPSLVHKDKVGTPPVHALMDDLCQPDVSISMNASAYTDLPMRSMRDPSTNFGGGTPTSQRRNQTFIPHKLRTPPSPGQSDPFYTQGELITPNTHLDDTWVTVFGFSPTVASFIVQRFSQYGTILSHHTASDGGNWMHIHYETSLQARKALSRNGKVFPENIMIGVVPCIDVKLMKDQQAASCQSNCTYQSPALRIDSTPVRSMKRASIRPLTAAYNAACSDHAVTSDLQTPQKTNGFLTKALDYIFG